MVKPTNVSGKYSVQKNMTLAVPNETRGAPPG